jgi:hypothetical protein
MRNGARRFVVDNHNFRRRRTPFMRPRNEEARGGNLGRLLHHRRRLDDSTTARIQRAAAAWRAYDPNPPLDQLAEVLAEHPDVVVLDAIRDIGTASPRNYLPGYYGCFAKFVRIREQSRRSLRQPRPVDDSALPS